MARAPGGEPTSRARSGALRLAVVLATAAIGCADASAPSAPEGTPTPAPAAPGVTVGAPGAPDPAAEHLARTAEAARQLGLTLKTRLSAAMQAGGPEAAVEVCATQAQDLTTAVGASTGVEVGRSSLRLRNPANAPRDWVAAWLAAQGERAAAGVQGISEIVETPDGRRARVLLPIAVEPPCLVCHGDPRAIPPQVRAILAERYPEDRATGYAAGDLRGALFAESLLE